MQYFRDVDNGNIVRKPDEGMYLEYISLGNTGWQKTEHNHSYEREYWLGEGNTCLFDLSEKKALKIIESWKFAPTIQQINEANQYFIFGCDTLYIVPNDDEDIYVLNLKSGVWRIRSNESFWFSWDNAPMLFEPIEKPKAIALSKNPKPQKIKKQIDFSADRILNSENQFKNESKIPR